jgi:hypothetical protein
MSKGETRKTKNNMGLWDHVCTTDPDTTRRVTQRGGFTAIDAQAQLKKATEVFGSYGGQWGIDTLTYDHTYDVDGNIVEICLAARFYYPGGEFPMATSMKYRPGDDCHKKLLTDLRSKCLSTLGFNSDVFEGKFDDNKYVENLKGKKQHEDTHARAATAIRGCEDMERLVVLREHYLKRGLPDDIVEALDGIYEAQKELIDKEEVNA